MILIVRQAKGLTVILTYYSFIEWVWAEVTPICVQHGQICLLIKMEAACQGRVKDKRNSTGLFVKYMDKNQMHEAQIHKTHTDT